jgi:hypothetical protein
VRLCNTSEPACALVFSACLDAALIPIHVTLQAAALAAVASATLSLAFAGSLAFACAFAG